MAEILRRLAGLPPKCSDCEGAGRVIRGYYDCDADAMNRMPRMVPIYSRCYDCNGSGVASPNKQANSEEDR